MVTGNFFLSQIWSQEKNYISLLCLQNCHEKSGSLIQVSKFQVKVIITILHLLWRNVRGLAIVTAAKFYVKDVFELEDNDVNVFNILTRRPCHDAKYHIERPRILKVMNSKYKVFQLSESSALPT